MIWLVREYAGTEFHGVDVDASAVEWCRRNLPAARFSVNDPLPPLEYKDGHFDVVYCLSVFTHLNAAMQKLWIEELHRILRPGGVIILTVHGSNARAGLPPADLADLEATGYLHKTSAKLKGIMPAWYHTTWHGKDYILNALSDRFEGMSYVEIPDGLQDFVVARAKTLN